MIQVNQIKKANTQSSRPKTLQKISPLRRSQPTNQIQCCYTNQTAQFQIVRIAKTSEGLLERAVPPNTSFIFEADRHDYLEIHTGNPITSILSDKIPCHRLANIV